MAVMNGGDIGSCDGCSNDAIGGYHAVGNGMRW